MSMAKGFSGSKPFETLQKGDELGRMGGGRGGGRGARGGGDSYLLWRSSQGPSTSSASEGVHQRAQLLQLLQLPSQLRNIFPARLPPQALVLLAEAPLPINEPCMHHSPNHPYAASDTAMNA